MLDLEKKLITYKNLGLQLSDPESRRGVGQSPAR